MKILIAEDDLASRRFMSRFMSAYGECDITVDGIEAIEAYILGLDSGEPYELVVLDVMMPRVDGIKALKTIRELEKARGIVGAERAKIIVTTALGETQYIMSGFETGLEMYINKPVETDRMEAAMEKMGLLDRKDGGSHART